jgi:hypothetical protein
VTRGDLGVAGEIKLTEMAALPPLAQMISDLTLKVSVGLGSGG